MVISFSSVAAPTAATPWCWKHAADSEHPAAQPSDSGSVAPWSLKPLKEKNQLWETKRPTDQRISNDAIKCNKQLCYEFLCHLNSSYVVILCPQESCDSWNWSPSLRHWDAQHPTTSDHPKRHETLSVFSCGSRDESWEAASCCRKWRKKGLLGSIWDCST